MNKHQTPLVSVCIPCYNAAKFIGDTLHSVLIQTYENIEIIICDDQSKDNSVEVIKQFEDSRITLHINAQNLGCSKNYNHVLSYAKGKYVKLLCADDLLNVDCIEKQLNVFENNPDKNIVLVTANKNVINEDGKVVFSKNFPGKGLIIGQKAIKRSVCHGTNIFGEPGLPLMKTDVLRQTTGIIEDKYFTYCNDFDLWCKMMLLGNLYVIDESLFSFRIVSGSVTDTAGWGQVKIFKDYLDKLYADKSYQITTIDRIIGKMMTNVMCIVRNMVYKLYFKKK